VRGRPDRRDIAGALRTLKRRLYPYQRDGVLRFLAAGRLVLADDMGLGKTAQAIAAAHVLFRTHKVMRGLLIVPASLKDQWLREWRLFSDVPLSVVDGSPTGRAAVYRSTQRGFLVTNYEQVLRDLDLIQRWKPDLVVLDEAQRIKNWATKTAAYVKTLTPVFRLVLTGTPMENRLDELASLLDWVDDMARNRPGVVLPVRPLSEVVAGVGGADGDRTRDLVNAIDVVSPLRQARA
jgi:SNF2 family DNA or RNA helicase